jgi:hypothetical protein
METGVDAGLLLSWKAEAYVNWKPFPVFQFFFLFRDHTAAANILNGDGVDARAQTPAGSE